jgi:hypothetical protein
VRTDYAFDSGAEALRVLGFFFGARIEEKLARSSFVREGQTIVPEHTAVYVRAR